MLNAQFSMFNYVSRIEFQTYKSATLRFALGKLRRKYSIMNIKMNGASQQKFNQGDQAGNTII